MCCFSCISFLPLPCTTLPICFQWHAQLTDFFLPSFVCTFPLLLPLPSPSPYTSSLFSIPPIAISFIFYTSPSTSSHLPWHLLAYIAPFNLIAYVASIPLFFTVRLSIRRRWQPCLACHPSMWHSHSQLLRLWWHFWQLWTCQETVHKRR